MNKFLFASLALAAMSQGTAALAATLVSTVPGYISTGAPGIGLGNNSTYVQFVAGQFSLGQDATVHSVSGWIWVGTSAPLRAALYANDTSIRLPVGEAIVATPLLTPAQASSPTWVTFSNLSWQLQAGTYWLAFEPSYGFNGRMLGGADAPLASYSYATLRADGQNYVYTSPIDPRNHWGIEIQGTLAPVDEPTTALLLSFGLANLLILSKRSKRCASLAARTATPCKSCNDA